MPRPFLQLSFALHGSGLKIADGSEKNNSVTTVARQQRQIGSLTAGPAGRLPGPDQNGFRAIGKER